MPVSTMMPDVTVEIAFTSGYLTPAASRVWTDVSAYVEAEQTITISRGRGDEVGTVEPSKLTVTLDNRDGRFTPGYTAGVNYPNVVKGRPIRVRAVWAAVTFDRFTGYVDEWPVQWPDGSSSRSLVTVTASSRMARMARGSELRSIIEQEYLSDAPTTAYYPLGEATGATAANGIVSGNPALTIVQNGTGGTLTFGTATGPGTDEMSAPTFTRAAAPDGKQLQGVFASPLNSGATGLTFEAFFNTSLSAQQFLVSLSTTGSAPLYWAALSVNLSNKLALDVASGVPSIASGSTVTDGATHHAAAVLSYSGGNLTRTLYLDGVQVATGTTASSAIPDLSALVVGGGTAATGNTFTGTVSHVAVSPIAISAARLLVHANAGLTGFAAESSDARTQRFARYAGVPTAEVTTEAGLSTSLGVQYTGGKQVLELFREVEATESGVLFDGRDGVLTFQSRSHRYNAATALTLSATLQEIEATLEAKLDDQYLINDVTVSRGSGTAVRVTDQTSIDEYGPYREDVALNVTSDAELVDAANWKLRRYSVPSVRISSADVDLFNCTTAQKAALLAADLSTKLALSGLPAQAPASTMSVIVEGYTESIGAESWVIGFNLSAEGLSTVWQLNSATYSVLDSTTILAY